MNDESFDGQVTQYPPLINIGGGVDLTIRKLAERVAKTVGFTGALNFDTSKPDGTPRNLRREAGSLKHSAMQENAKRS